MGTDIPLVAVVACNQFSPFHLSVPCMIFGDVLPDKPLFRLRICRAEEGVLRSGQGLQIEAASGLDVLADADIVVVPYWRSAQEKPNQALLDALVAAYARGSLLVGLCLGTYVLAWAGLLTQRNAATHWEFAQDFQQRFPDVHLDTHALYVEDGRLITSAGTAAGLDCCLHLVRKYHGSVIANRVARRMVIPPHREGGQAQFIERPVPTSTQDGRINALLAYLRSRLSQPHHLDELARQALMSRRTFTRQFHKATGMSVGEWLMAERLQQSQVLLESTTLSIEAIAEQVGFSSATPLRQYFRRQFNVTPGEWRKTFQGR
ncbi:GlxA family transcriptional regulator [Dickeya lacustris]|uniref:Helix-turn-helix domain-containing protein n=1 Tax=Dickeya lacustris TaxID=2259638 RepID=A0ABY8G362_9GAMM|nr:helix-turn-helix domain-containing protein [Dickeya lacustris]WFN54371.1 helix-turn-helix domain-containing protein [Dickeya lacustris]